ncbi:hypothetical protein H1Q63_26570 [Desmonostoc muscorum CCALA 125]|nr:hypothetical protein [Desmonostoc muscorum CCALA 125]
MTDTPEQPSRLDRIEVGVSQAEINEVWLLLSENQRSHLWQLHQEYQQQSALEHQFSNLESTKILGRGVQLYAPTISSNQVKSPCQG